MTERPKIKFLTAIWGERYIEEFASISLPSYMSPGNLPALAAGADLEILIMTSEDSRDKFDEQPIFARLGALCTIRYLLIDDLITGGNYGVTLTLAFARGIMDSGAEQTSTTFLFMNSDFVLADGALRTTLNKINEGHRCIMAPSLRASTEPTLPHLAALVDNGTLTIEPRALVQLAFDNLHPTVFGKAVTQDLSTCLTHNQVYWQVNESALLARYHLIFMLAIKPEVPLGPINSYCDYGFVPEMIPSGKFIVLDDSDEFFMLELQALAQESSMLHAGTSSSGQIARELSKWTTREHRRFAEHDVLFHTADATPEVDAARGRLASFMGEVKRRMRRKPLDHVDHYYWVLGLEAWALTKFEPEEKVVYPPEVVTYRKREGNLAKRFARFVLLKYLDTLRTMMRMRAKGPNVPLWHNLWLDYRLVTNQIGSIPPRGNQLAVCDNGSTLKSYFAAMPQYDVKVGLNDVIEEVAEATPAAATYDGLFLHVHRATMRSTRAVLAAAEHLVKPHAPITIYVEHAQSETDASNFSFELTQYMSEFLPPDWMAHRISTRFTGGYIKRWLRLAERRAIGYMMPSSVWRVPLIVIGIVIWPVVAALTVLNNAWQRSKVGRCPQYCSSFIVSLDRRPPAAATIA